MFEEIIEEAIQRAFEEGGFRNLHGAGKPMDLSAYFETPAELCATFSILRNAGVVPEEIQLLNEIRDLEQELDRAPSDEERVATGRRLRAARLNSALMREARRHGGRP